MKIIRGAAFFVFFSIIFGSCFDEPKFPDTPEIEFVKMEFVEVGSFIDADSLIVYIDFKDGDGDLGIAPDAIDDPPFHTLNFYTGTGGQTAQIAPRLYDLSELSYGSNGKVPKELSYVFEVIPSGSGKMVTLSDRNSPYTFLPPNIQPYTCLTYDTIYFTDTIFVDKNFKHILKPSSIVDSLLGSDKKVLLYAAVDYFYATVNPDQYNYKAEFLIKSNQNNTFVPFNWRKEFCTEFPTSGSDQINGRFTVLTEEERPLEGTLRYAMVSVGFPLILKDNQFQLKIQIQDRALNKSNVIETSPATLSDIRRH